jgi:Cof subfamily protein (haloacid dehalogenase superfamily)
MKKIKLVASDLDGTLLTSSKEVTPRLMFALEKLTEKGIYFVPATGRVYNSLPESVKSMPFLKYVITSNGAVIYDVEEKRNVIENCLTKEDVYKTLDIVKDIDLMIEIFTDGKAYTDKKFYYCLDKYGIKGWSAEYVLCTRTPVNDIFKKIDENIEKLENINLIFFDNDTRLNIMNRLKEADFASVTTSSHNNVEVTSRKATKANAIKELCTLLNIESENVVALGDSDNDLDMIMFAGTGIAMENGDDHIKKAADIITKDCDNFGAALIIEQIAEKGEI